MQKSMIDQAKELMRAGEIPAAVKRLQEQLAFSPDDEEAKLLLGTCRHLLGDDKEFLRIGDELANSETAQKLPSWPVFQTIRAAACGGALLMAGTFGAAGTASADLAPIDYLPWIKPTTLRVPMPNASDGTYSSYVRISWASVNGAKSYEILRATSANFKKAKTIAWATETTYKDKHPAARPRKKYYYWIVPHTQNHGGKSSEDSRMMDSGYAKQILKLEAPSVMTEGSVWKLSVSGNAKQKLTAADCTWRIVSGASCATISRKGKLTAKRSGTVVVAVSYNGVTTKATIRIEPLIYDLYAAPYYTVTTKYAGPLFMKLSNDSSASPNYVDISNAEIQ